ncbi:hypothetical protein CR513_34246, partial [Mucuna pruriens]
MVLHIAKAKAAAEELKGLLVCNSVEETTKRIDKLLMVLILRSLHPDYEYVRDQILSNKQIPSMSSLVTRLLWVPTIKKGDSIVVENSAMVASCGRGRSSRGIRGMLRNDKDSHKTANISSSNISSNGRIGSQLISDEEYQEFLRLKSNNHAQSSASPSVSIACISHSMGIDSSASSHISGNDFVFPSISSPKFPHFISLANGSKMVSQGVGKVSLSSSISLNFVLYIPKCPYNLISLSQMTRSLNCSVIFYAISFIIQNRNMGQLIGKGHESRGLYCLKNSPSMLCFVSVSPKLLHNRLEHPNLAKLKLMANIVRSTFPNQVNKRCNFPFSIIHSNIWGPSRVTSFGFNYFITFIDEYSRCTWVYLMKERSKLLSNLLSFSKEVENQFGKTIKILRSDNAKGYFSSELNSYLSSKGILHQPRVLILFNRMV